MNKKFSLETLKSTPAAEYKAEGPLPKNVKEFGVLGVSKSIVVAPETAAFQAARDE